MTTITETGVSNPFVGLRPFREEEQNLFFGRESLVDHMVDKLAAHRFLAVVGGSGSGKSSLVNCGLKPALRRGLLTSAGSSWRMVQFRPGTNPNQELAIALVKDGSIIPSIGGSTMGADLVEATLGLSGYGLVDIYKQSQLGPDTNLLVVVDQFEELFRYRSLSTGASYGYGPETIRFVRLLLDAASQNEVPIYIVLTMRSDFLGDCAQFDGLPEAISEGQYLVPRLTRAERRAAIEGPIHVVFSEISTALLTRLVNDVGDNPDQLSILQHAMNRTWAHWHHDRGAQGPINMDDYVAVGTMTKALDGHANKAYGELPHGRKQFLCQRAFKALTDRGTDPRGVRRPTKFANLCEIVGATPDELLEVLGPFRKASRSFLMPAEGDTPGPDTPIDISHESLMRVWVKLSVWTNEEAEAAREYRRVSDRAEGYGMKKSGLMQDPDLQTALDFEVRQQPTAAWAELYGGKFEQATQFLRDSEERNIMRKANRELERRWQLRWQPIIIAVAVLGFFLVLFWNSDALLPKPSGNAPPQSGEKALPTLSEESKALGEAAKNLDSKLLDQKTPADNERHEKERREKLEAGKQKYKKLAADLFKYLPRDCGVAAAFGLLGFVAIFGGRKLHRKLALPAIVDAIRHPVKIQPAAQQQVQDPAAAIGTTYAAWWRRSLALAIDLTINFLVLLLALAMIWDSSSDLLVWLALLGWLLGVCAYHVLTESSRGQASLGMWAVRTYVTDLNGRRLSRWRVLRRQLFKVVALGIIVMLGTLVTYGVALAADVMSSLPFIAVPIALLVSVAVLYFLAKRRFPNKPMFRRRQRLSDYFSKTVVVVGRPAKADAVPAKAEPAVAAAPALT